LYAYRVNENIVILFNGGVKLGKTAQESKVSMHFSEAQHFVARIEDAFADGTLGISDDNKTIVYFDDNEMIL
jgi:hypothetical protein